ncbi:VPLPA-CTERM sorting domain-containing protein [Pseudotabrizicola formosa]|uniref:VPLPA-CTERM sorting domain-containing protein n=1 Tax=Pseudotabrizicola formosa TaxID=2030009 RepID=UPI000CD31ECB|nr:VPLPA-CTERM sorting domain-containing protein [Pseudotabrizicola formosa]
MKNFVAGLAVATLVSLSSGAAFAATIIDGTTQGLYNSGIGDLNVGSAPFPCPNVGCGDPNVDYGPGDAALINGIVNTSAALGNWLTTPTTPGGTWSGGPVNIPSTWSINSETAIIYAIDAGATGLSNVIASFGVDNGLFVWLNGVFQGGHLRSGGVAANEFVLNLGSLGVGMNYLQVLREDHGGSTGYSVLVTGDVSAVPLPAAGWLMLAGIGGLAALRRRRKAA